MKYALVNKQKKEATKGLKGFCQCCGSELTPKCGEIKVHHWAHKSKRNCDPWWENETEWHRAWKNEFPSDWQEVLQHDQYGEKHIADVKTIENWVIEFQHSFIKNEERLSRDAFYNKLIWIVDGKRRKTDFKKFQKTILRPVKLNEELPLPLYKSDYFGTDNNKFINEWLGAGKIVFFDFNIDILWYTLQIFRSYSILSYLPKYQLVNILKKSEFSKFYEIFSASQLYLEDRHKMILAQYQKPTQNIDPLAIRKPRRYRF